MNKNKLVSLCLGSQIRILIGISMAVAFFGHQTMGCGGSGYDLSGLLGVTDGNSGVIHTIPAGGGGCPVRVRITVAATVDISPDHEDAVWITHAGHDVFFLDSSCGLPWPDGSEFHPQQIIVSNVIEITPEQPVTLDFRARDGDSWGNVSAMIVNAQLVSPPGGGGCSSGLGSGGSSLGSFAFNVGLGMGDFDADAGTLSLVSHSCLEALSPSALRYNGFATSAFENGWPSNRIAIYSSSEDWTVTTNWQTYYFGRVAGVEPVITNGAFRQVLVPQGLADIVPLAGGEGFAINIYHSKDVNSKNGDGLYTVSGDPWVSWELEHLSNNNTLVTREIRQAHTNLTVFENQNNTWVQRKGDGTDTVFESRTVTEGSTVDGRRSEIIDEVVSNAVGVVVSRLLKYVEYYANNPRTIMQISDPGGTALTNRWWYDNEGRELARLQANGGWEISRYGEDDQSNLLCNTITPWQNQPFPENLATNKSADFTNYCQRILQYNNNAYNDYEIKSSLYVPGCVTPVQASKSLVIQGSNDIFSIQLAVDGLNVTNYSETSLAGEPVMSVRADGVTTLYQRSIDANAQQRIETTFEGLPNSNRTSIVKGHKTIRIISVTGQILSESQYAIPEGLLLSSMTNTVFDDAGRPQRVDYLDGTYELNNYGCCGLESHRDREGACTYYEYDSLKRIKDQTRNGITEEFDHDAAGRTIATWRYVNNVRQFVSSNSYDVAGRLTASMDAGGRVTSYGEAVTPEGFTVRTTTNFDGTVQLQRYYLDGQLERESTITSLGMVHPQQHEYGVVDGFQSQKDIKLGANGETNEWVMTLNDGLGRLRQTIYSDGAFSLNVYNEFGQLVRATDLDGITTLYRYNALGEQEYTVVSLSTNLQINFAGKDRISHTYTEYGAHGSTPVQRQVVAIWPTMDVDTQRVVSVQERSLDGLKNWSMAFGQTNFTTVSTWQDGTQKQMVTSNADGSYTLSLYVTGRLVSTEQRMADGTVLASTTNSYDSLNRLIGTCNARGLVTTNEYDQEDRLVSSTIWAADIPAQVTRHIYDSYGRAFVTIQPDGGAVTNEYYPTGAIKKTYGSRTYPVEYEYDVQGRMIRMSTWQDFTGDARKANTYWAYDPQRGFMVRKTYADSNVVQYAYTSGGKLKSRTWARGLETTYLYGMGGDLESVQYSDTNTPTVLNTFDRLGRIETVEDGSGRRTLIYTNTGAVVEERYSTGPLAGTALTRGYDQLGRLSAVTPVFAQSNLLTEGVTYTYDGASRLATASYGANTETWSYWLGGKSNVVRQGTDLVYVQKRAFDSIERLTSIESQGLHGGETSFQLGYSYGYNTANQRTNCAISDGEKWDFGYDSLGQVTNGVKRGADGAPFAGYAFGYKFDDIGNRQTAKRDDANSDYTANLLNQYVERTVPGQVVVMGEAATNVVMQVNGVEAQWQNQAFYKAFTVDNAATLVYSSVEVKGMTSSQTNQTSGHRFTPQTPESFVYDLDGNLAQDGRWNYTWDGENRLIGMETRTNLSAAIPCQKLAFTYDSQSRRIKKSVFFKTSESWILTSESRFLYDGWNLVSEIGYLPSLQRVRVSTYVWGPDLSGTFQGAGGIGGLLASTTYQLTNSTTAFYAFDGNGNVMALVDSGTLQVVAQYEYSPFGEVLRASGPQAKINSFQFSTKYYDGETGMNYYGYRYYQPEVGRWVSRDPLGEEGSDTLSLYDFIANNPGNNIDPFGLTTYGFMRSLSASPINLGDSLPGYFVKLKIHLPAVSAWPTPTPQRVWQLNHWVDFIAGMQGSLTHIVTPASSGYVTDNFYAKVGGISVGDVDDKMAGVKAPPAGLTVCMLVHKVEKKLGWNGSPGPLLNSGTHGNVGGSSLEPGDVMAMSSGMRVDAGATLNYQYRYLNNKSCECQNFWSIISSLSLSGSPLPIPAPGKIVERLEIPGIPSSPWEITTP